MYPEDRPQDDLTGRGPDEGKPAGLDARIGERVECPWCGVPLNDPFACDYCEWGRGGEP
jgi:hypothetical protein